MHALLLAAALMAQSGRSYGPSQLWWNAGSSTLLPWQEDYDNAAGLHRVINRDGAVRTGGHPFFEALGTNQRACVTCHQPADGMSLSAKTLRDRWAETRGTDPVFAAFDGSNCPDLPQSEARSHSLLLDSGLVRIPLAWPPKGVTPEFTIEIVRDPAGCNVSPRHGLTASGTVSVYRRPRVAANLSNAGQPFALMADGREPSLASQARNAILGHMQASAAPSAEDVERIVAFESQIHVAQHTHVRAGLLSDYPGAPELGPAALATRRLPVLGMSPGGLRAIRFEQWEGHPNVPDTPLQREFRASVVRGAGLFHSRVFGAGQTCASCHAANTRAVDIGTTTFAKTTESLPQLPLFRVRCRNDAAPHPALGRDFYSHDPGRALVTGKCADAGAIVMQQFRGLPARAPYFSNGRANTLEEVIEFYDRRYGIGLTPSEKADLANLLSVL